MVDNDGENRFMVQVNHRPTGYFDTDKHVLVEF